MQPAPTMPRTERCRTPDPDPAATAAMRATALDVPKHNAGRAGAAAAAALPRRRGLRLDAARHPPPGTGPAQALLPGARADAPFRITLSPPFTPDAHTSPHTPRRPRRVRGGACAHPGGNRRKALWPEPVPTATPSTQAAAKASTAREAGAEATAEVSGAAFAESPRPRDSAPTKRRPEHELSPPDVMVGVEEQEENGLKCAAKRRAPPPRTLGGLAASVSTGHTVSRRAASRFVPGV